MSAPDAPLEAKAPLVLATAKTVQIAVSAATFAIDKPYSYRVPGSCADKALPGARVAIPFGRGNKKVEGIILSVADDLPDSKLKSIDSVLDDAPLLDAEQLSTALWMAGRFFCTVFEALKAMLPAGVWYRDGKEPKRDKTVKYLSLEIAPDEAQELSAQMQKRAPMQAAILNALLPGEAMTIDEITYKTGASTATITALVKRGVLKTELREVFRRPEVDAAESRELTLTKQQEKAYYQLQKQLNSGASAALLCGVTGSGKTTIYIKLIGDVLESGKTAIVLVPEISLTPQMMSIFVSCFHDEVAVLHSALSVGERYDEWKRIKSGGVKVVIGTRSAIFAPLENIGLIVIDEEQEHTYKSESSPRYHARDIAKYRCAFHGAMLLLGSATPSIESMYSANGGTYSLVRLPDRYNARSLPDVLIADLKEDLKQGSGGAIGRVLGGEIFENLKRGEQSILFINRRGASSVVSCGECGYTFSCPNCDVSMTYHSANHRLMCHYCGHSMAEPERCPDCGGRLKYIGAGTQKVEEELRERFHGARVLRMDADTISASNPHTKILRDFREGRADILLGTQMVAKGLDFENVTLVGVVFADLSLYINDYRAHERTFSLITQVVGRAGRGGISGRAVIQTMTPGHEVIRFASRQDYDGFYEHEIARRELAQAPPLRTVLTVAVSGPVEEAVLRGGAVIRDSLRRYLADEPNITVLGPAPAAIVRVNNRFRYRVTLMCQNTKRIRDTVAHTVREFSKDSKNRGVSVFADIDPFE